jgi:hypothetical protein
MLFWLNQWARCTFHLSRFATLCLLIAGCALVTPTEEPLLKQATAEQLTALLSQREASLHSMKGLFSAKIRGGILPMTSRVDGVVYYRRPNALRLRGFHAPIGYELFELVQADDLYKLRLPTLGRVLTGRQSEMKDMGKLARPFQLSVWAMGGVLGNGTIAKGETVKLIEDGAEKEPTLARRLWFDRRTLLVVREDRLAQSGEIDATIQYEDFRPLDDPEFHSMSGKGTADGRLLRPFKISLEDGRGQGSVQLTFHEILPNQAVKAEDLGQVS